MNREQVNHHAIGSRYRELLDAHGTPCEVLQLSLPRSAGKSNQEASPARWPFNGQDVSRRGTIEGPLGQVRRAPCEAQIASSQHRRFCTTHRRRSQIEPRPDGTWREYVTTWGEGGWWVSKT
jgi:hypothetical protein